MFESFEVNDLAELSDWAFATTGSAVIQLDAASATSFGTKTLRFEASQNFTTVTHNATVQLDLSQHSTATDLTFDFWMRRLNSSLGANYFLKVEISNDGMSWSTMSPKLQPVANTWLHYVYDLDAEMSSAAIVADSSVYLRLHNSSASGIDDSIIDAVRIGQFGDLFGPRVESFSPNGTVPAPVTSATVTFNEAINPSSFSAEDIALVSPNGLRYTPVDVQISTTDGTTFTIQFPTPLAIQGTYAIEIGPLIEDVAGNLMNSDQDEINGETAGSDTFRTGFVVGPSVIAPLPYQQGFEVTDLGQLDEFSFAATGGTVTLNNVAHLGGKSLLLGLESGGGPSSTQQYAELVLDLQSYANSGDLSLDFWVMRGHVAFASEFKVRVSNDGQIWRDLDVPPSLVYNQWLNVVYDLDERLDALSIIRDSDVYFRLYHTAPSFRAGFVRIDDLRVENADRSGAFVESLNSVHGIDGRLEQIEVSFSEPIDAGSFTAEDVLVRDMTGDPIGVTVTVSPNDTTKFLLTLESAQSIVGDYGIYIGPNVLDAFGNPMDQNQNGVNAETGDRFFGTVNVGPPNAQSVPYFQGFEVPSLMQIPGWSFEIESTGTVDVDVSHSPVTGFRHLVFDYFDSGAPPVESSATLIMDLSDQNGATDLTLDFKVRRQDDLGYTSNVLSVSVSGDGNVWTEVLNVNSNFDNYQNFVLDLDQKLAAAAITPDGDVFIRFAHSGSGHWIGIDDVRVANGNFSGPRILSTNPATGSSQLPVDSIDVTFDQVIDVSTFSAEDVVLVMPSRQMSQSISSNPVDNGDKRTFTIPLDAPITIPGKYYLQVGSEIRNETGNPMNQNMNSVNGQMSASTVVDDFETTIDLRQTPAAGLPYFQGFDSFEDLGSNWFLWTWPDGTIDILEETSRSTLALLSTHDQAVLSSVVFSINLAAQTDVRVRLDELNLYDTTDDSNDGIFISDNRGATWFRAGGGAPQSSSWVSHEIDLDAAIAAANMSYTDDFWIWIRQFGEGRQYDNFGIESGTAIDAFLNANETAEGTTSPPVLTISRDPAGDLSAPLIVHLVSSDESEASVPPSVTLAIGESSVDVPVTVNNDDDPDGPVQVNLIASIDTAIPRSVSLTVMDDEPATLVLEVSTPVSEADGPNGIDVMVRRNRDNSGDLTVSITHDGGADFVVPASVVIPDGAYETTFKIYTKNDFEIDGPESLVLTANAAGLPTDVLQIDVQDDDTAEIKTLGGTFSGSIPAGVYQVLSDLIVAENTSLTFAPGSVFRFADGTSFKIAGSVEAIGTENSMIQLTSLSALPRAGDWSGIDFNASSQARTTFGYVDLSYANIGFDVTSIDRPQLSIHDSYLHDNREQAVLLRASEDNFINNDDVRVERNTIADNGVHGVAVISVTSSNRYSEASPLIAGNEISGHSVAGIYVGANYIAIGGLGATSAIASPYVHSNYIHHNGSGIYSNASQTIGAVGFAGTAGSYHNNIVVDNTHFGFELDFSGGHQSPHIVNNTIANNGAGIWHSDFNSLPTIRNNLVVNNGLGIWASGDYVPNPGQVGFNDIFGNTAGNWVHYPKSFGGTDSSNAQGTPSDFEKNISVDPGFVPNTLYQVEGASPINDAGTSANAPDRDYVGRLRNVPVDLGAYESSAPPTIERVEINGGDIQRSSIDQLALFFDQEIQIDSDLGSPFRIVHVETGVNVDFTVLLQTIEGKTTAMLTPRLSAQAPSGDALPDGNYRLIVYSDKIFSGVTKLDGDGDGQSGDDYSFGEVPADGFFRFFGDTDGDRDVDGQDYGQFAHSFLKSLGDQAFRSHFDYDADGDVDGQDYGRFRRNLLKGF